MSTRKVLVIGLFVTAALVLGGVLASAERAPADIEARFHAQLPPGWAVTSWEHKEPKTHTVGLTHTNPVGKRRWFRVASSPDLARVAVYRHSDCSTAHRLVEMDLKDTRTVIRDDNAEPGERTQLRAAAETIRRLLADAVN